MKDQVIEHFKPSLAHVLTSFAPNEATIDEFKEWIEEEFPIRLPPASPVPDETREF
jgi:hypothetical protein